MSSVLGGDMAAIAEFQKNVKSVLKITSTIRLNFMEQYRYRLDV